MRENIFIAREPGKYKVHLLPNPSGDNIIKAIKIFDNQIKSYVTIPEDMSKFLPLFENGGHNPSLRPVTRYYSYAYVEGIGYCVYQYSYTIHRLISEQAFNMKGIFSKDVVLILRVKTIDGYPSFNGSFFTGYNATTEHKYPTDKLIIEDLIMNTNFKNDTKFCEKYRNEIKEYHITKRKDKLNNICLK